MEPIQQAPKIELYRVRDFGAKVTAVFSFVRENWRPLLKYLTYMLLPLCLVQGLLLNSLMRGYGALMSSTGDSAAEGLGLGGGLGGYLLVYLVGYLALLCMVYTLMQLYGQRPERLQGLTGADLRPLLARNGRRVLVLLLVGIVAVLVAGTLLASLSFLTSFWTLPLLYIGLLVVMVPFALTAPIYLFEDLGLLQSLGKAWHLGWPTWGGIAAVGLVLGLIANVLQMAVSVPWYILVFFQMLLGTGTDSEAAFSSSVGFSFLTYLAGVVQSYGSFLAYSLTTIGLAYQYGHASEKIDHTSMDDAIEQFENL